MNILEFATRTNKFLNEEEIAHYEEWYEPAYMATSSVDKDEFCKLLKNPTARKLIKDIAITIAITEKEEHEKFVKCQNEIANLKKQRDTLRDALRQVDNICKMTWL